MTHPNLNALRMFDAAARHQNFRLAADELNLTQGAVAQQVRGLEKALGQPLFARLPRGLALTSSGAAYHSQIRQALDLIDRATAELQPAPSSVTLSVPPSLASKWLVPRLASFSKAYPDITLQTHASETVTDFRRDAVDVAIRQGPAPDVPQLCGFKLADVELCAVASPAYLAQAPTAKKLVDFARHNLIEDGHKHWAMLLENNALPAVNPVLSFNQTGLAIDAATNGQGVALAPRLLVRDVLEQGYLVAIWSPPDNGDGFHILHPQKRHKARDHVIDWLKRQVQHS